MSLAVAIQRRTSFSIAPHQTDRGHVKATSLASQDSCRDEKNGRYHLAVVRALALSRAVPQDVRDPRFSQLSGQFDGTKFRNHYKFLSDMREGELATLRDNLKRARKLLTSSPRHLRAERNAEVERLTLAVKRAESSVNRDKRERVEQNALSTMEKEERQKRQEGKKPYWLKDGGPFLFLQS